MIDQTLPTPLTTAVSAQPPVPIQVSPSPLPQPVVQTASIPVSAPVTTSLPVTNTTPAPIIEQHPIQPHPEEFQKQKTKARILKFLSILVTAGLTLEGLKGLYESLFFVFVEYQHFEEALVAHEIEGGMINQLALKAGLLIFSTAISLFFAIQMTLNHTKVLKILHILAGIIVAAVTFAVMYYANSIDILGLG